VSIVSKSFVDTRTLIQRLFQTIVDSQSNSCDGGFRVGRSTHTRVHIIHFRMASIDLTAIHLEGVQAAHHISAWYRRVKPVKTAKRVDANVEPISLADLSSPLVVSALTFASAESGDVWSVPRIASMHPHTASIHVLGAPVAALVDTSVKAERSWAGKSVSCMVHVVSVVAKKAACACVFTFVLSQAKIGCVLPV
jgi:hypothetical protein